MRPVLTWGFPTASENPGYRVQLLRSRAGSGARARCESRRQSLSVSARIRAISVIRGFFLPCATDSQSHRSLARRSDCHLRMRPGAPPRRRFSEAQCVVHLRRRKGVSEDRRRTAHPGKQVPDTLHSTWPVSRPCQSARPQVSRSATVLPPRRRPPVPPPGEVGRPAPNGDLRRTKIGNVTSVTNFFLACFQICANWPRNPDCDLVKCVLPATKMLPATRPTAGAQLAPPHTRTVSTTRCPHQAPVRAAAFALGTPRPLPHESQCSSAVVDSRDLILLPTRVAVRLALSASRTQNLILASAYYARHGYARLRTALFETTVSRDSTSGDKTAVDGIMRE
jgi:hypothetical protein